MSLKEEMQFLILRLQQIPEFDEIVDKKVKLKSPGINVDERMAKINLLAADAMFRANLLAHGRGDAELVKHVEQGGKGLSVGDVSRHHISRLKPLLIEMAARILIELETTCNTPKP